MNSKKIFISIFIIIAIVFMTANVFAYTMKENISTSSGAEAKRASENFRNLKLTSASFDRNTTNSVCKLTLTFDRTINRTTFTIGGYSAVGVLINEKPSMESRRAYGSKMDAIVSSTIILNNDSDKILTNSSYPQFIDPDYKAIIFWHRLGERTLSATYNCAAITSNNVDVYIFRPERSGAGKLNNVYLYDKEKDNIRSLDLRSDSSLLAYSNNLYYLYNVDYAYNLPVNLISQTNRDSGNQSGNSAASIRASSTSTSTAISCDSSFRTATELGYQASWTYKCNEDKTSYHKCDNGVYAGLHKFSPNSRLKPLICTSDSTETIESTTTTETSQNKVVLTIENNTNISDINYSLDNTNWYSTKKIDFPKSFILGNKTNNKTINVDLDMFTEGTIYAIVSTVDKRTEIDNELKTIYQTGNFTGYNLQTSSNVFEINNTLSLSKLQYTLDNTKKVKLNISSNITNGDLVIIFMQKSQDNSKVNLVYSNLYVLDEKEQSQYYLCEINKKIVSFYCRGHNCNLNISCMKSNRWDFDNGLFVGLTPRAVETATPLPTPTPTPEPTPTTTQSTDLQKGADGCYTTNPTTLAKIRQENGIGITKQLFSGKRNANSIVVPLNNTGTDDDPSLTIAQIRTIFNRSSLSIPQKVKDASPAFYNLGILYDIDPVYSLAFFRIEKSLFNQNSGSVTSTMISKNDISGVSVCRCGGTRSGSYCAYPTLEQGIEAFYLNLVNGTTYAPSFYKNDTFQNVARKWNRGNITNPEGIAYSNQIITFLSDKYTWAGK